MEKMNDDNEIPPGPAELSSVGVLDVKQAARDLLSVRTRLGDETFRYLGKMIGAALRRAGDPDLALNFFERFVTAFESPGLLAERLTACPETIDTLMVLFGASRFLSVYCIATAGESLPLLGDPRHLAVPAGKEQIRERLSVLLRGAARDEDLFRGLRLFRKRELLRIALRDLLGKADLSETVSELSHLAEVCLQAAYEWYDADLRRKHGRPLVVNEDGTVSPAGFAVIGMGKLGGGELNFSSDVDLMYVYSADGETEGPLETAGGRTERITNHQYFVKLAEQLSAAIGRTTADGFVFRVDLRLRPEGQRGPLAQSIGGYEIYYESWGQTWERSALIKARFVAGNKAVGREFLARITPFVYRKYLDYGAIGEIRSMKLKINREVRQKGREHRDVKLGYGGIREIEFLVQSLQLIYGGRDRALRERGTMRALHLLAQKDLLTFQEVADLMRSYVFLRTVEHRLQMLNDLQTQTLPDGDVELRALARRSGYLDAGKERAALLRDYAGHTRRVRAIYDALLGETAEAPENERIEADVAALLDPGTSEHDAVAILANAGFLSPDRAYRNLALLREGQAFVHQTPRSRRVFQELFPRLFREVSRSPDPDRALNHLESYLAAQGSWDAFQAFLGQDSRLLESLVSVFGNSDYFSRMLVRTPSLLDDLLDGATGAGTSGRLQQDLDSAMAKVSTIADKLDALRRFKHREELRIGMADLSGALSPRAVGRGLSRLAEACLRSALRLAAAETARRYGGVTVGGLAVLGAGKLGGRELIYGSDLDILFVFDGGRAVEPPAGTVYEILSKAAEKTISYLSTMTREGAAYRVDTRLRPTGSKGPLIQSIEAFRSYFSGPAETWERQALVNARFVAGDRSVGDALSVVLRDRIYPDRDPATLAEEVRTMRKRMEDELGKEDGTQFNIKQGRGGLVDIEFLAQYLLLRHGRGLRRLQVPGTVNALRALRQEGILAPPDAERLCTAYLFLRGLESRMRIVANQSTSMLPRDPEAVRTLARRLGYDDGDGGAGRRLLGDYERTHEEVRELFDRLLRP